MAKKKPKKSKDDDEDLKKKKAKAKAKERDEEEEEDEEEDEEEEAPRRESGKPKADIYVGLGFITLTALVAAAVFFYLDTDAGAKGAKPAEVSLTVNELRAGGKAAPQ